MPAYTAPMPGSRRIAHDPPMRRSAARLLLALVALAIIGAQAVGLVHRVEHSDRLQPFAAWQELHEHGPDCDHDAATRAHHDHDGHTAPEHNCAALDALTLGDSLASAPIAAAADAPRAAGIASGAGTAPRRLAVGAYRARAPPALS
jgi:hypothetical protein